MWVVWFYQSIYHNLSSYTHPTHLATLSQLSCCSSCRCCGCCSGSQGGCCSWGACSCCLRTARRGIKAQTGINNRKNSSGVLVDNTSQTCRWKWQGHNVSTMVKCKRPAWTTQQLVAPYTVQHCPTWQRTLFLFSNIVAWWSRLNLFLSLWFWWSYLMSWRWSLKSC